MTCEYDYVTVYDGQDTSAFAIHHCGTEIPTPITSTGRHFVVHFTSDNSIAYRGFEASYRFVDGMHCRLHVH